MGIFPPEIGYVLKHSSSTLLLLSPSPSPFSSLLLSPSLSIQHIGSAHNYSGSSSAKAAVATVGKEIQLGMYPESLGPMIFTFTGAGNVSQVSNTIVHAVINCTGKCTQIIVIKLYVCLWLLSSLAYFTISRLMLHIII